MACFQELCRVQITWLRAGNVCQQSKLAFNDYSRRNVIACVTDASELVYRPARKNTIIEALLNRNNRSLLEECISSEDPLVEVCVPVTLYEFCPLDTIEGCLEAGMFERGATALFSSHLEQLAAMGEYFDSLGRSVQRGCWGRTVCFHTLWVFKAGNLDRNASLDCELAGYIDLGRVPLGVFAENPPSRTRPAPSEQFAPKP